MLRVSFGLRFLVPTAYNWEHGERDMAVYRVDVLTDDAGAFQHWVCDHVPKSALIRSVGFRTVKGWYFKNVFSDKQIAEQFHRHWYPDAADHIVVAFRTRDA